MVKDLLSTVFLGLILLVLAGCRPQVAEAIPGYETGGHSAAGGWMAGTDEQLAVVTPPTLTDVESTKKTPLVEPGKDDMIEFNLRTEVVDGRIAYLGVGGEIDGVSNPDLFVQRGITVRVNLINGDGVPHDISFPDFKVKSTTVSFKGKSAQVSFVIEEDQSGTYAYFCTMTGHRQAGQEGELIVIE
jgi:nitrite reductase (NO-forming)